MLTFLDEYLKELEAYYDKLREAERQADIALEDARDKANIAARRVTVADDALSAARELKKWLEVEALQ